MKKSNKILMKNAINDLFINDKLKIEEDIETLKNLLLKFQEKNILLEGVDYSRLLLMVKSLNRKYGRNHRKITSQLNFEINKIKKIIIYNVFYRSNQLRLTFYEELFLLYPYPLMDSNKKFIFDILYLYNLISSLFNGNDSLERVLQANQSNIFLIIDGRKTSQDLEGILLNEIWQVLSKLKEIDNSFEVHLKNIYLRAFILFVGYTKDIRYFERKTYRRFYKVLRESRLDINLYNESLKIIIDGKRITSKDIDILASKLSI